MQTKILIMVLAMGIFLPACSQSEKGRKSQNKTVFKVVKSDDEWKSQLSPMQYKVLRKRATEAPFNNEYWDNHQKGTYVCAGCQQPLFDSETKFDSGTGWPSFFKPMSDSAVLQVVDRSHGMVRDEILCSRCGGHLGHVFDFPTTPTKLRYCMNSASLQFEATASDEK